MIKCTGFYVRKKKERKKRSIWLKSNSSSIIKHRNHIDHVAWFFLRLLCHHLNPYALCAGSSSSSGGQRPCSITAKNRAEVILDTITATRSYKSPEALNNPGQEQMPQCLRYSWMTNNPHQLHRSHLTPTLTSLLFSLNVTFGSSTCWWVFKKTAVHALSDEAAGNDQLPSTPQSCKSSFSWVSRLSLVLTFAVAQRSC